MIDLDGLLAAYRKARIELLGERSPSGCWTGRLSSSALSTATAVSALTFCRRALSEGQRLGATELAPRRLEQLIQAGLQWLVEQQNEDGGWGDTELSHSNLSTTLLARAAFALAAPPADFSDNQRRAASYIDGQGGPQAVVQRYGKDKTFAVPILTNAALAGLVPWDAVAALPFEAACVPQRWYRWLQLPVVSYAIPALVAIGQAKFLHDPPKSRVRRWIRHRCVSPSLDVLAAMQPESGGYLEAIPLTSFVVMALVATGRADHPVVASGVRFLLGTYRDDGSWPIDSNLSVWNTTLAINALGNVSRNSGFGCPFLDDSGLQWLLKCQARSVHRYTGAGPGGWGWSDLSGAVPDADDTPGALLALDQWRRCGQLDAKQAAAVGRAASAAGGWLLKLQNRDGGWPTFCRGWGKLLFDRSGTDLTAHCLRGLMRWRELALRGQEKAITRGFEFLQRQQRENGCWIPLWFGNQDVADQSNPVYGTAKVLMAYRDADRIDTQPAVRGLNWLVHNQNRDGGWGSGIPDRRGNGSSVEETALAVEALVDAPPGLADDAFAAGLRWLVTAVETGRHRSCSPIGFYFAKLWYYEKLYPLVFAVSALGRAVEKHSQPTAATGKPRAVCPSK